MEVLSSFKGAGMINPFKHANFIKNLLSVGLVLSPVHAFAHLLTITPIIPFPANVLPLSTTTATFAITNTTSQASLAAVNQSTLPNGSGLALTMSTCDGILAPGESCTVAITLTAPASFSSSAGTLKFLAHPSLDYAQYCIHVGSTAESYVTDDTTNQLFRCGINATGGFNDCLALTPAGTAGWNVYSLALARSTTGVKSGYVSDNINNLYHCASDFSRCSVLPAPTVGWTPTSVSFQTINATQYSYVVDADDNRIFQCPVNADGSFGTCAPHNSTGAPSSIIFQTSSNGVLHAYVTDPLANTVSLCGVDQSTGALSPCIPTPVLPPVWTPTSIAFNTLANGTQYAYVADTHMNVIYQCNINADGELSGCIATPPVLGANTVSITFATQSGVTSAYISNHNGSVIQCGVDANNGHLNNCLATPAADAPAWHPRTVAISEQG